MLAQFKNRVSVVLCHAKVSRASGGSASRLGALASAKAAEDDDNGIAEGANIRQSSRILQRVEDNAFHYPRDVAQPSQRMIWTKTCVLAYTRTTFPVFDSRAWNAAATSASSKNKLTRMAYDLMEFERLMRTKKRWIKPTLKTVPIFFECTCYAGAV